MQIPTWKASSSSQEGKEEMESDLPPPQAQPALYLADDTEQIQGELTCQMALSFVPDHSSSALPWCISLQPKQ